MNPSLSPSGPIRRRAPYQVTTYAGQERTVDVHTRRLRERLEEDPGAPPHILTKYGIGYRMEAPKRWQRLRRLHRTEGAKNRLLGESGRLTLLTRSPNMDRHTPPLVASPSTCFLWILKE